MFASNHISTAGHWWRAENNVDAQAYPLLLFLFRTLDALYADVQRFPQQWAGDKPMGIRSGGKYGMYIGLSLSPDSFALLRAAIALQGDSYFIGKRLESLNVGGALKAISQLVQELERFRELRNFFSHLDERIANLDEHGITGTVKTNCGIEYDSAYGCFHLVLVGNVLHFSNKGAPAEADVSKTSFLRLLQSSRSIYEELTAHKIHKPTGGYPAAETIYA